jgi:hypothetical protein
MDIDNVPRTLSYLQCIHLIQRELGEMPHGSLIIWCAAHHLTYKTVIGVKSNKLNFFAPRLIGSILEALGYEVYQITKITRQGKATGEKSKGQTKEDKKKETFYVVKKPDQSSTEN